MERAVVLCARSYSFTDRETGKLVEGATVTYLTGDVEVTGDRRGMEPMTVSAPREVVESLDELPAVCDLDFKSRPGPKGRPQLVLTAVSVKGRAPLEQLFAPAT